MAVVGHLLPVPLRCCCKAIPGARLKEYLSANDSAVMALTMAFEDAFEGQIVDSDAERFIRVGDLIRYLRGR